MRAWWRRFKERFLDDEAYFVGVVRSAIATVAAGGLGFAQQVAAEFGGAGRTVFVIRSASVVAIGVAMFMRAGDKNESDEELRERLKTLGVPLVAPGESSGAAAPPAVLR